MTDKDVLLKEFEADLDLYKFYMNIAVKITIWVIAITGAILSFYFANASNENGKHLIKYSLYFPLFINVAFFVLCARSISLVEGLATDHLRISESLGIQVPIRLRALPNILLLFTLVYLIVSLGIGCAIFLL